MAYLGREAAKAPLVTADLPNDGVTLAKMAGIARGKIIYGDATGPATNVCSKKNWIAPGPKAGYF